MIQQFLDNMENATFAFAIDGKYDMMSLNPLEMTNFEMMGTIFGFGGVLLTLLMNRMGKASRETHEFEAKASDEAGIDQYP